MDLSMKDTFIKEMHKVKEDQYTQMVKSMKEIGYVMKLMDMVFIHMKMVQLMKEIGNMIYNQAKEQKNGLMEGLLFIILAILRDNMNQERKMVMENSHGQMDQFMRVISNRTILKVRGSILGQMENTMKVNGF